MLQDIRRALPVDNDCILEPDSPGVPDGQAGGGRLAAEIFQNDIRDRAFREFNNDTRRVLAGGGQATDAEVAKDGRGFVDG